MASRSNAPTRCLATMPAAERVDGGAAEKHVLSAVQLAPLAKMIAQQLAQEADGVGWREPLEQLTAGER